MKDTYSIVKLRCSVLGSISPLFYKEELYVCRIVAVISEGRKGESDEHLRSRSTVLLPN